MSGGKWGNPKFDSTPEVSEPGDPSCGWCHNCDGCMPLITEAGDVFREMLDNGELDESL